MTIVVLSTRSTPHNRYLLLQRGTATILCLIPGLLYVRFIESRGPAVWNEYVFNLLRLGVDYEKNLPVPLSTVMPESQYPIQSVLTVLHCLNREPTLQYVRNWKSWKAPTPRS